MQHIFDDSPADQADQHHYFQQQEQQQNPNAGGGSDYETQYKSYSEGILNQSIFSEGINKQNKDKLQVDQAIGHKSVDFHANLETRGGQREPSFEQEGEEYLPLHPLRYQEVDQASVKTW